MKFIHISDLHFGKNLYGYSMVDEGDQKFWCDQFLNLVNSERPQAILISGDVYDRGIPPKEAVELLDWFLTAIAEKKVPVYMIAGNHDSGTRLSFGSRLLQSSKIHIAGAVTKEVANYTLEDEYGPVTFWLVPYIFPAAVQMALGDDSITGYDKSMRRLLAEQNIDFTKRNVILSHQTVMNNGEGPEMGGSETTIGGIGEIDVTAYDGFDYVALGHIHAAQKVRDRHIRYAGSPLCYHFSELSKPHKGPVIVELKEKGNLDYRVAELPVLHQMREIKGKLQEILHAENANPNRNEYLRIVLTDDRVSADARNLLLDMCEKRGHKLMETAHEAEHKIKITNDVSTDSKQQTVDELFLDFFRSRNDDNFPEENDQDLIRLITEQVANAADDEKVDDKAYNADVEKIIDFVMKQEGNR